jgi:hypothetical protein
LAAPEKALTFAVPDVVPVYVARAIPPTVAASWGEIVPNGAENVTIVPFCGAVPDDSVTTAVNVAVPPIGTEVLSTDNVIVEPVGEVNGTFSHAHDEHAISKTSR